MHWNNRSVKTIAKDKMSNRHTADEKWLHKRKMTVIGFAWEDFLLGCQQGILLATAWLYIKQVVEADYQKTFYAVIMSVPAAASIVISPFVGKIADRYRNVRTLFFVGHTLKIIGNLLYTVHFSPSCLVVGRAIAGLSNALESVVNGELARSYGKKEVVTKLAIMALSRTMGILAGPLVNLPFTSLDVHLGELRITFANVPGIYMAVLHFVSYFTTYFMVHNLSKEFDMKQCAQEKFELVGIPDDTDESNHRQEVNVREVILKIFTRFDTCLIIMLSLFESAILTTIHVCNSLLVIDVLKWTPAALNGIIIGTAIFFFLPAILLVCFKPSDKNIYRLGVIGIFLFSIMQLVFIILKLHPRNLTFNVILVVILCVLQAAVTINVVAFQKGMFAKMVSSRCQSVGDSVRFCSRQIGTLAGLLSGPYVFSRIEVVGTVYIGVIVVLGVLAIARRKTLSEPRVII